ncbi:MAG: gamma-glutamyl-gamma-aminobutyrate hydrolase family protein [Armatimonadetes bacterium]|nr:gamma-glutamyl-gamma-aminobutyrate hydrolase family protein [Armatimonadota bacterium]
MRSRPLIGITCSTVAGKSESVWTDGLKSAYASAVWRGGGTPVLIPNLAPEAVDAAIKPLDGLLLSGGRDIEPRIYGDGDKHSTVELDTPRDAFELPLALAAYRRSMPILGICRGIQALNVALGGTLWQDLPSQTPSSVAHRQGAPGSEATHALRIEPGSALAGALGHAEMRVNTFHHQAVKTVAGCLRAVGWAEDGLVEALESPDRPFVVAVQYHPEEMAGVCEASARLFAAFVAASRVFAVSPRCEDSCRGD